MTKYLLINDIFLLDRTEVGIFKGLEIHGTIKFLFIRCFNNTKPLNWLIYTVEIIFFIQPNPDFFSSFSCYKLDAGNSKAYVLIRH